MSYTVLADFEKRSYLVANQTEQMNPWNVFDSNYILFVVVDPAVQHQDVMEVAMSQETMHPIAGT